MATLFGLYSFLLKLYADDGYQGPQFQGSLRGVMRQIEVKMAGPLAQAREGLGVPEPFSPSLPEMGIRSAYALKALPANKMVSDRFLGQRP